MRKKVLLVGNDINNATPGYSWEEFLKELITYVNLNKSISIDGKPFPLLYEEILLNSARQLGTKESALKAYIASKTQKLELNLIHTRIIDLGIQQILTTNYDLTLERAVSKTDNVGNEGIINEKLYSLFRVHGIGKFRFWHVHGCESYPNTITLGYEHYSGYLQQMRNYVVNGTKGVYQKKDFQALAKRIKEDNVTHESWVDYFFTHDIHIFGLNLDFVEMHLWWLITYRARVKIFNKLRIKNRIYYYYPTQYEGKSKHKLQLMNANEVETVSLPMNGSKINYYKNVLNKIQDA